MPVNESSEKQPVVRLGVAAVHEGNINIESLEGWVPRRQTAAESRFKLNGIRGNGQTSRTRMHADGAAGIEQSERETFRAHRGSASRYRRTAPVFRRGASGRRPA